MIEVISHAKYSYAEVVRHSGTDACRVGGEAYEDNSRTSKVCKAHRAEYQRQQREKHKTTVERIAGSLKNHA